MKILHKLIGITQKLYVNKKIKSSELDKVDAFSLNTVLILYNIIIKTGSKAAYDFYIAEDETDPENNKIVANTSEANYFVADKTENPIEVGYLYTGKVKVEGR